MSVVALARLDNISGLIGSMLIKTHHIHTLIATYASHDMFESPLRHKVIDIQILDIAPLRHLHGGVASRSLSFVDSMMQKDKILRVAAGMQISLDSGNALRQRRTVIDAHHLKLRQAQPLRHRIIDTVKTSIDISHSGIKKRNNKR